MALFPDDPPPLWRQRRGRGARIGAGLLTLSLLGVGGLALVPSPYVIQGPGPVYDTLGEVSVDGEPVPMISIADEETYPTGGSLDLLTVSTYGNRENLPNWFEVVTAWFDARRAVLPLDAVYPPGYSVERSNEDNRILMENSQKDAVAAALTSLGYEFPSTVTVGGFSPDSPSEGILELGDELVSINGEPVRDVSHLRAAIASSDAGEPLTLGIRRGGEELTVSVTPELSDGESPIPIVGIYPAATYDFPIDIDIQLHNVGGPSGGQMFALGIVDKLTPGALNGGEHIAGTGSITAEGRIGRIGGIRQKLYGALDAGAKWFLAPEGNCDEVVGHIPDGLRVASVGTLDDSIATLEAIAAGDELPAECAAG